MKTMHLFAGVGGGILGDLINGHEPIIAVEWDKYACQVLRERVADGWFPNMQVYEGDVRLFDPSEYAGRVACIHAGFPCQDISNAGKQAGVGEETRSGLYREVLRIADMVRPQYIFLENVSAIISNGLGTVLGDLASRSYDARWICVRASDVGANHQRDRWWLLAKQRGLLSHSEHNRDGWREQQSQSVEEAQGTELAFPKLLGRIHSEPKEQSTEARLDALGNTSPSCADVAYALCEGSQGLYESIKSNSTKRQEAISGSWVDSCSREWWQVEPNVGRVVDGLSTRSHQLKALGNGQVPLQAAVAFKILEGMMI